MSISKSFKVPILFLSFLIVGLLLNTKAEAADLITVAPPCYFTETVDYMNSVRGHAGSNSGKADDIAPSRCNGQYTTLASISGYINKGITQSACNGAWDLPFLEITSFDGTVKARYLHGDYSSLTQGAYIEAGQPVGNMGQAGGCSSGNHIHIEIYKNNVMLPYSQWKYGDYASNSGFRTMYDFNKLNGNHNTQGWVIGYDMNYLENADGGAIYGISGTNPNLLSPRLNLITNDITGISFTAAGNGGTNCGQIYIKMKGDSDFSSTKSVYFATNSNGSDTAININLSGYSWWNPSPGASKLTQVRIDPCGSSGGFRINNFTLNMNQEKKPVYRFWNALTNKHILVSNDAEKSSILKNFPRNVWVFENRQFYAAGFSNGSCAAGYSATPIYRLVNVNNGAYFYTRHESEKNTLNNSNPWLYEQIDFCAWGATATLRVPVYRFWSDTTQAHVFTSNPTEINNLNNDPNWDAEDIVFYVLPL